ncbi:hypothetical protein EVAR_678_1 [Eumeta japonica]|uniref:Uncharacterized protein n=1 Tax=Eumeta variegata TaxID=151549 RepID=A0A4C1SEA5_EUMVA|nr:hypothetical protein EVAR_678_1 [Eumeta japonica]
MGFLRRCRIAAIKPLYNTERTPNQKPPHGTATKAPLSGPQELTRRTIGDGGSPRFTLRARTLIFKPGRGTMAALAQRRPRRAPEDAASGVCALALAVSAAASHSLRCLLSSDGENYLKIHS